MNDKDFSKYWFEITAATLILDETAAKRKVKQILEEIESNAFKRGVSKLLEIPKDIEVELIKLKEAKP